MTPNKALELMNQPRHYSNYRFPVPEAARQASLIGIEADLNGVVAYCDFLIGRADFKQWDSLTWEGISSAAVVRYARCFMSGVREPLEHALVANAPEPLAGFHEYVMALRNKHVAHSVNAFEENDVTVQIGDHFQSSAEIQSLGGLHERTVGLALNEPQQLKDLAAWVIGEVQKMKKQEEPKLLALARQRPLDELKAFGIPMASSGLSQAGLTRPRAKP